MMAKRSGDLFKEAGPSTGRIERNRDSCLLIVALQMRLFLLHSHGLSKYPTVINATDN